MQSRLLHRATRRHAHEGISSLSHGISGPRISGPRDSIDEFRVHETQLTNSRSNRLSALAPAPGWGELAACLLFEVGNKGRCTEVPAGLDVLAQHVELPARRGVVEEAAPVGDQSVEGARLDEIVVSDAEMCPGAGPGPVLRP